MRAVSKVDRVAARIRDDILAGKHEVGGRLPPERVLCVEHEVHRLTLRAALDRLVVEGLLVSRQGSGYRVCDFRVSGGPRLLAPLAALGTREELAQLVGDLLMVYRQLVAVVLPRLATHIDEGARSRVGAALEQLAVAAEAGDPELVAERDLEVVRAFLHATGSPVLALFVNPIAAVIRGDERIRRAIYADPSVNVSVWAALAAWMADPRLDHIPILLAHQEQLHAETLARL